MTNEMHTHNFLGKTSFNIDHSHGYSGMTTSDPDEPGHIHYMEGIAILSDGHTHTYRIPTSPAIHVKGGHYHYYTGATSIAYIPTTHAHSLVGYTSIFMG